MNVRTIASVVLMSLALIEPAFAQARFPFTGRVKADRVHVRAGQSNNYEEVAVVNKGDELIVVGKNYSWYKVRLPESAKLYIKTDYAKPLTRDIGEVTGDRVNIRARAGTDAAIIGQLVRGDRFFIRETAGQWIAIRPVIQAYGWIHEDYIEFKSPRVALEVYAVPKDAPARAGIVQAETDRKRMLKSTGLKPMPDGQYEAEGILSRVAGAAKDRYKLTRADKSGAVTAYVEGPGSVLSDFLGVHVVVRGVAKDDSALDAALLAVVRINLAL